MVAVNKAGWVMVTEVTATHPVLSVTVTVYVPALNPIAVELVCPPGDQE
jgi:hypothetical protein